MTEKELTKKKITEHCAAYPGLHVQDIFKFLHQSSFGCEHMVTDLDGAVAYIKKEYEGLSDAELSGMPYIEQLDGPYCRVHLRWLQDGLAAETLGKLFVLSAKPVENGRELLEGKLSAFLEMNADSPAIDELVEGIATWRSIGFEAMHHSDEFRELFNPAYRVIKKEYARFLPLFTAIDKGLSEKECLKVAIEGGSASGKTTLGDLLKDVYGCTLFHMDDFFLQPGQRTPERFEEVGGNVDYERFRDEVTSALKAGSPVVPYRRFDCQTFTMLPVENVELRKLIVTEGAYSLHPTLCDAYDLKAFLLIDPELQKARIRKRNSPELAERFFNEWIPYEEKYFSGTSLKERVDLVIPVNEEDLNA